MLIICCPLLFKLKFYTKQFLKYNYCIYVYMCDLSVASISGESYKHKYSLLNILVDYYLTSNS